MDSGLIHVCDECGTIVAGYSVKRCPVCTLRQQVAALMQAHPRVAAKAPEVAP